MKKIEAPYWWSALSRSLRFLIASLILVFSTSGLYPQEMNIKIIFFLSILMLLLQSVDIFLGNKKLKGDEAELEIPKID